MRWIRDLAMSMDGRRIAFLLRRFEPQKNEAIQSIWWLPTDGSHAAHQLTRGRGSDHSPKWSPDGRFLAFIATQADDPEWDAAVPVGTVDAAHGASLGTKGKAEPAEPKAQIWVLDLARGGDARQLTRREEGVSSFDWSPDGMELVFASRAPTAAELAYLDAIRDKDHPGPLVLSRVQHKLDGKGYLDTVKTHLFIVHRESRDTRQLTSGAGSEDFPQWSPTGHWIGFLSNRTGDADNNGRTDLYLIRSDGKAVQRMTQGDLGVNAFAFGADRSLWFLASPEPENAYVFNRLYRLTTDGGQPSPHFPDDLGEGFSTVGGQVLPFPSAGDDPIRWAHVYPEPVGTTKALAVTDELPGPLAGPLVPQGEDGVQLILHDQGRARLIRVDASGRVDSLADPGVMATIRACSGTPGGMAVVTDQPDRGPEVCRVEADGSLAPLTEFMTEWLVQRTWASVAWETFRNPDGDMVKALVTRSPQSPSGGSGLYPLIVLIHGGPMAYDAPEFDFDAQYWASLGYVILQVNYRGSTSYGQQFSQVIQGEWGPREHADVMAGIDCVLAQGLVDPDRIYCTGFSQGGVMTNWAVGHSDRFRAAASEHGLWDYVSAFGTDDCHGWWQDDLGVPWQNLEGYLKMSPMSAVERIATPLLIMAGETDWRCPLSQAEEMYLALKKRKVETELVIYPGEHHAISRPNRAMDRLHRIAKWFERYGGQAVPDYR